jgi:hypothetical protein
MRYGESDGHIDGRKIKESPAQDKSDKMLTTKDTNHTKDKAVLKPPQSRRWRDCRGTTDCAKRLDCGAFTAAFGERRLQFSSAERIPRDY